MDEHAASVFDNLRAAAAAAARAASTGSVLERPRTAALSSSTTRCCPPFCTPSCTPSCMPSRLVLRRDDFAEHACITLHASCARVRIYGVCCHAGWRASISAAALIELQRFSAAFQAGGAGAAWSTRPVLTPALRPLAAGGDRNAIVCGARCTCGACAAALHAMRQHQIKKPCCLGTRK
jgi:hypothetical protein